LNFKDYTRNDYIMEFLITDECSQESAFLRCQIIPFSSLHNRSLRKPSVRYVHIERRIFEIAA